MKNEKNKICGWIVCWILISTPTIGIARNSKFDIESRLNNLENKINSNLNFELANKLEFVHKELQELRGILEEQQHIIRSLIDQNNRYSKKSDDNTENDNSKVLNVTSMLPDQAAYNDAYKFIEKQKFKEALMAFKEFLLQYKDSKYAPNAIYWVGELYLMDHKLDLAADYFLQITEKFKNHDKSVDALLKLGDLEIERGNYKAAKSYFLAIKDNYHHSSRAYLADKKLNQLETDGY